MSDTLTSAEAIKLWQGVSTAIVVDEAPDLTMRQMAILLTIYLDPPPHTVRGLAAMLGVTKPVITRALNTMGDMDLVTRKRDPRDMRNVIISRTVEGALFLEKLGDLVVDQLDASRQDAEKEGGPVAGHTKGQ